MKREEILQAIKQLGNSQGAYQRLYAALLNLPTEIFDTIMIKLEQEEFKDVVDMVMYLEGQ